MRAMMLTGAGLAALAVAAAGGRAGAQTAAPPSDSSAQVEEVVVTANHREQSLRDVPMSVSVVTGQDVKARGVESLVDLARAVPGLNVTEQGPGQNRIYIRGISNPNGLTSLVGLYMDEIPVTGSSIAQLDLQLDDLDRVEVLKGPQGTLYGQGSAGGTIRFITRKPDLQAYSGQIEAEGYGTEHGTPSGRVWGVVNAPVIKDVLGFRVSGVYAGLGGWIDQPAAGRKDINDQNLADIRVQALFTPTPQANIQASVDVHRNHGADVTAGADADYDVAFPNGDPTAKERFRDNFEIYNLTGSYDFGWAKLLSSTSYIHSDKLTDGTSQQLGLSETFNDDKVDDRTLTEEMRLSSTGKGPLTWVVGVFYTDDRLQRLLNIAAYYAGTSFGVFPLPDTERSRTISGFGDASYALTSRLTVGAGLRYFHDDRSSDNGKVAEGSFDSTDPRFYADYKLTPQITLYANVAKGFRSGGFEGDAAGSTFGPEEVWTYEVGGKGQAGRLTWEVSPYYSTYKGYQAFALTSLVFGGIVNAGDAEVQGVDFLFNYRPISALTLQINGNVNRGTLVQVLPGAGADLLGDRLDYIPDYAVSASAEYRFHWTPDLPGFVRGDYNQIGAATFTDRGSGIPPFHTNTLGFFNARLGVEYRRYRLELFGQNLLGENGIQDPSAAFGEGARPRPRTLGAKVAAAF